MATDIVDRLRDRERLYLLEDIRPLVQVCEAAAEEITRLRAALAEAREEIAALQDSESCEAITLRTKLAEAERERDMWERRQDATQGDLEQTGKLLAKAEAALAEAREIIPALVREIDADGLRGHWTAESLEIKTKARAFLERTATASVTSPNT